jgi:DNA-directed RNA polymerase subunit RPC12/RpoP
MPTLTREIRSGASSREDGAACLLTATRAPRCPACSSGAIGMAPGHILADATGMIRIEYRCGDCDQDVLTQDLPGLWIVELKWHDAYRTKFKGVGLSPFGTADSREQVDLR